METSLFEVFLPVNNLSGTKLINLFPDEDFVQFIIQSVLNKKYNIFRVYNNSFRFGMKYTQRKRKISIN